MDETSPVTAEMLGRFVRTQAMQPEGQAVANQIVSPASESILPKDAEVAGEDCSAADIEAAYQRALDVFDWQPSDAADSQSADQLANSTDSADAAPRLDAEQPSASSPHFVPAALPTSLLEQSPANNAAPAVSAAQVVEAVMFVGGQPVTAKRLNSLLGGHREVSDTEQVIDELNTQFGAQNRPYEIRLGEGGYRLELLPDFEPIRSRVYGLGPREVKLSQDVVEILSLVAYKQPITRSEIEAFSKENVANLLRQLLRRDLIAIRRGDSSDDVRYVTTDRFLSVFGLTKLDELPQSDDLDVK
ncbi:MAG: SMC-Scp complex subunit ScpB [Planctomycetales bacterium]|nr:SMC-Scp complex subunit ScpB [Planctomycetales bacterium]